MSGSEPVYSAVENQQVLIKALCQPSIFPHASNDLTLLETHISWVILCGDFAYKIKKALHHPGTAEVFL